jgi:hypothetical protein
LSYISVFISTTSLSKYLSGIRHVLTTKRGNKGTGFDGVFVTRYLRSMGRNYGLNGKEDLREPLTADILSKISQRVAILSHNERCLMAVVVIGFVCCARIGEISVTSDKNRFLRRKHWIRGEDKGEIYLQRTKTDIYGRGTVFTYVTMKGRIDPVFWMRIYAERHVAWKNDPEEALFMKDNGQPVNRKDIVAWLQSKTREIGHPKWMFFNGISLRRGMVHTLRGAGLELKDCMPAGRWKTQSSASRYARTNEALVRRYAAILQAGAEQNWERTGLGEIFGQPSATSMHSQL